MKKILALLFFSAVTLVSAGTFTVNPENAVIAVDPKANAVARLAASELQYYIEMMTGKKIPGTQIPYWEEAKKMCLEAMQIVPQVRFVAWDVAITPKGPVFIEGNSFPSHAIPQFAAHFPDGIGILPRFEEFIDL